MRFVDPAPVLGALGGTGAVARERLRGFVERLIEQGDALRTHLYALVERLRTGLAGLPWRLMPSQTAIQPLLVGESAQAVALSEALRARGIWVAAIRPPTVPEGTARLRITLSAAHTEADVEQLMQALHALAR